MNYVILIILQCSKHRCLQSCVGTWARLGYAAFDAQLRKRTALHRTLYTIVCIRSSVYGRLYTCVSTLMLVWGHATCLRVRSLWYEYTTLRNNPGNARACLGLQAPMIVPKQITEASWLCTQALVELECSQSRRETSTPEQPKLLRWIDPYPKPNWEVDAVPGVNIAQVY